MLTGAVAGCSTDASPERAADSPATSASTPSSSGKSLQLSSEVMADVLTSIDFDPEAFDTPEAMFASIYPNVDISPECLKVFGIDSGSDSANVVFGPSVDRTLTAQVSSFDTGSEDYFAALGSAADACISDPQLTYSDAPVEATVTRTDPSEGIFDLTLTASLAGNPVTVIGKVERFEENVVSVVGWNPKTNATHVPQATGMIVEALSTARIDRINGED